MLNDTEDHYARMTRQSQERRDEDVKRRQEWRDEDLREQRRGYRINRIVSVIVGAIVGFLLTAYLTHH